jgi:hypothetical protein
MNNLKTLKTGIICILILLLTSMHSNAADRYWVGTNANKNWNTTTNWSTTSGGASGASVPGTADDVYFTSSNLGELILDVNINVRKFTINSGYTNNISQNGKTIVVGAGGMILNDGTFTGNTGNITVYGIFTLAGTNFTSTANTLLINGNYTKSSGTFSHNNGTVTFLGTITITGSTNFYDLNLWSSNTGTSVTFDANSTFNVTHNFYNSGGSLARVTSGTLNVQGDIIQQNVYASGGGGGIININGTGNQLWTGQQSTVYLGYLCNVTINKASGTLFLKNVVTLAGTWNYVNGIVDDTTYNATISFPVGSSHMMKGTQTINRLYIGNYGALSDFTVYAGDILTIRKSLTTGQKLVYFAGNIKLWGDYSTEGNSLFGSPTGPGVIEFCGDSDQILSGTDLKGAGLVSNVLINKNSGTLILKKTISVQGNWIWQKGAIDASTYSSTVLFTKAFGTRTISGNHSLYNVCFYGDYVNYNNIPVADVLTVTGTLNFESTASYGILINGGTVKALGDIFISGGASNGSTGNILIAGVGDQLFTGSTTKTNGLLGNITINKPSGTLILKNYINSWGNWTYIHGNIDGQTYESTPTAVVFNSTSATGKAITGSHSLYHVCFIAPYAATIINIDPTTTLTVDGDLALEGAYSLALNGGNIDANRNVTVTNTSITSGGNGTINIKGTANQTLTGSGIVNGGRLCNVNVSKTGGTLTLASIITIAGNWTYAATSPATLDAAGSTVILPGGSRTITGSFAWNNLTIYANANSINDIGVNDIVAVNGELKIDGSFNAVINTGTINAKGNITITNTSSGVNSTTGLINICGAGSQTLAGANVTSVGRLCNVNIDKPSGTLFLTNFITVLGNWTYIKGTVDPGTSTVVAYILQNVSCVGLTDHMSFYNYSVASGNCTATLLTDLYVKNDLNLGATLNANGKGVYLGGNWIGGGVFTYANSSFTFNGTGNQYIYNPGNVRSVHNLIINKPSGKVYANNTNLLIYNSLSLQKGILTTKGTGTINLYDNVTCTGGSNASYVAASIKKTGNDVFTFALGDTTLMDSARYHPISITAPAAATDVYTAQYYAKNQLSDHPTFTPFANTLNSISTCEYWSLIRTLGTSTITPTLGWNSNACNLGMLSNLRVASWSGTQWTDLGQNSITGNTAIGTIKAQSAGPNQSNQYYVLAEFKSTTPIASFYGANARSLAPVIEWSKNYGGSAYDYIHDVVPASDGGYLMSGSTYSSASGDVPGTNRGFLDYWIAKINATGDLQWSKNLGSSGYDSQYGMVADGDGGCTVVGEAGSGNGDFLFTGGGNSDIVMTKLDANGNVGWIKLIGGSGSDLGFRVMHLKGGGLLILGLSTSATGVISGANNGDWDGVVIKTDNGGNVLWTKIFGSAGYDFISGAVELASGELVISGTYSTSQGEDFLIAKLSSTGTLLWQKTYGGSGDDDANAITRVPDGFVLTGYTHSTDGDVGPGNGGRNAWTIKTDDNGNLIWKSVFGGSGTDNCQTVLATPEGGSLGFGQTSSNDFDITTTNNSLDGLLVKYNSSGQVEWHGQYGGPQQERIYNASATLDGGYIMASNYESASGEVVVGRGSGDGLVTKLKEPVTIACAGATINFSNTSINGISYQWKVNNVNAGTSANLTYMFATAGTYTVSLTATNGSLSNTKNSIVSISGLTANAGISVSTSAGSGVTIGGTLAAVGGIAPYTYLWTPGTGLSSTMIANPVSTLTATTSYTLSISDAAACTASAAVLVTIEDYKSYGELKKALDAGYYQVSPTDHTLYFSYNEEYKSGGLNFKIYDNSHELKSCPTAITKKYGDNRYGIDLTNCLGASTSNYYLLEVINDKSEKLVLKFKY